MGFLSLSRSSPLFLAPFFFLIFMGGRESRNVIFTNKFRIHHLHPLFMADDQDLSPDDAWLSQYRQLAENTIINDYGTLAGDNSVAH